MPLSVQHITRINSQDEIINFFNHIHTHRGTCRKEVREGPKNFPLPLPSPSHIQLGSLEEHCKLPTGVWSRALAETELKGKKIKGKGTLICVAPQVCITQLLHCKAHHTCLYRVVHQRAPLLNEQLLHQLMKLTTY